MISDNTSSLSSGEDDESVDTGTVSHSETNLNQVIKQFQKKELQSKPYKIQLARETVDC